MKSTEVINRILTSPFLSTSIFLTSGVAKTYKDYKNADEKYKNGFLLKDTVVLAGAASGMFLCSNSSKYLVKIAPVKKIIEKQAQKLLSKLPKNEILANKMSTPMNYAKEIVQNTFTNFSLFASGVCGALIADYLLGKMGFKQPKINKEKISQEISINKNFDARVEKIVGEDVKNAMYERVVDMPQLNMLTSSLVGAAALDLSKETETKTRLKKTTSCLINMSLIPMLLLSSATALTQKLRLRYKIPIIFTSLVGGTVLINRIQEHGIKKEILKVKYPDC